MRNILKIKNPSTGEFEPIAAISGADGTPGKDGQGVPTGGTVGQVLKKTGSGDYETGWSDSAGDSEKLGGVAAAQYALKNNVPAHNLLDNSDFRNPVNQRGQSVYQFDSGYTIDRWKLHWSGDGNITIHDGYIGLYRETYNTYLFQFPANVDKMVGKTYTVAAKVRYNGYIGWIDSTQRTHCDSVHSSDWVIITHTFTVGSATSDIGQAAVEICSSANMSIEMQWIALYEGSYDASTLPAYQPKGYAAELAECQRYFERLGGTFSQCLGNAVFAKAGAKSVIISIKYSPKRLSNPTLSFSNTSEYRMLQKDAVNASTISAISISSFDNITMETPFASFRVNLANALASDSWLILQRADGATGAYIDVNADM